MEKKTGKKKEEEGEEEEGVIGSDGIVPDRSRLRYAR